MAAVKFASAAALTAIVAMDCVVMSPEVGVQGGKSELESSSPRDMIERRE